MDARLVATRQWQKKGTWYREVTIDAPNQKTGFTAGELMDVLIQVPAGIHPRFFVRIPGQVKQIKFTVEFVPEDAV
jgi:hypothetical protein